MPLIPPPPAPLNIAPSRARRRLADRLALHKQQAAHEASGGPVDPTVDDPFASLGDDDQDATDPFALDEDEQDITASGNRNKVQSPSTGDSAGFSVSRGLTSLFSSRRDENYGNDDFDRSLEDSSSSSDDTSSDSEDPTRPTLEAKTSLERQPLDVDDDEEMGEMVAPSEEEGKGSSDEETSPRKQHQLHHQVSIFGSEATSSRPSHLDDEADGTDAEFQDPVEEEEEEEGDELVEIAMPVSTSTADGRRNSQGRG